MPFAQPVVPGAIFGDRFVTDGTRYYTAPDRPTNSSNAAGEGNFDYTPFPVNVSSLPVTGIAAVVVPGGAGSAGSELRMGIWRDNGKGQPGALFLDCGAILADTIGLKVITISTALSRGLWHLCSGPNGNYATFPTVTSSGPVLGNMVYHGAWVYANAPNVSLPTAWAANGMPTPFPADAAPYLFPSANTNVTWLRI